MANSNAGANNVNNNSGKNEKFDIQDLRDPGEINNLSTKQLKILLTRNCIDYRGVFEKEVLREKVMQLWIDHNERLERRRANARARIAKGSTDQQNNQDSLDDIDESQLCKICMEREIDCVLLECGHYLTCVACGRKLAECPICRQNITRCVRTFRS